MYVIIIIVIIKYFLQDINSYTPEAHHFSRVYNFAVVVRFHGILMVFTMTKFVLFHQYPPKYVSCALYSCFLHSLVIVLCHYVFGYFLHDNMKIVMRLSSRIGEKRIHHSFTISVIIILMTNVQIFLETSLHSPFKYLTWLLV